MVRSVPNAFKKGGIAGNVHLRMTSGQFAELEALCEAAEALGFVEPKHFQALFELSAPIEAEIKALSKASREHARDLVKSRTSLFGAGLDEEDDDF